MRRYLGERERAQLTTLLGRARRRGWLLGRIAIKDAVRTPPVGRAARARCSRSRSRSRTRRAASRVRQRARTCASRSRTRTSRAVAIVGEGRAVGIDSSASRRAPRASRAIAFTRRASSRSARIASRRVADAPVGREGGGRQGARHRHAPIRKRFASARVDGDRLVIDDVVVETRRDGDTSSRGAWRAHVSDRRDPATVERLCRRGRRRRAAR